MGTLLSFSIDENIENDIKKSIFGETIWFMHVPVEALRSKPVNYVVCS